MEYLLNVNFQAKRPIDPAYPDELRTLGDHLRKVRLDRALSQPHVANLLGVTPDTVTGWELNRHEPYAKDARQLIQFLGYIPSLENSESLGGRLRLARQVLGMTQREAAKQMGCDPSTVRLLELDLTRPAKKTQERVLEFCRQAFQVAQTSYSDHE